MPVLLHVLVTLYQTFPLAGIAPLLAPGLAGGDCMEDGPVVGINNSIQSAGSCRLQTSLDIHFGKNTSSD